MSGDWLHVEVERAAVPTISRPETKAAGIVWFGVIPDGRIRLSGALMRFCVRSEMHHLSRPGGVRTSWVNKRPVIGTDEIMMP